MRFLSLIHDHLTGRERLYAYVIAALTVLACWVLIVMSGDRVKSLDEPDFYIIAENLAFNGAFADKDGVLTAYRAPGLVFFLAPFVWLGAGLMELRLINASLIGFGLILVFHLVQRRASPLAGLFAVALIPTWPVVIYASTTIYPQTLAAFLLVLTIWYLDQLRDDKSLWTTILAGLACGALILTIPITLLVFPIFVGWIFFQSNQRVIKAILFCIISGAFVCSWTARNYIAFGAFVPVATSSGFNLLAGNTPEARYNTSLDIRFPDYVYDEMTGKNEVEQNDIMTKAALKEIKEDPGRVAVLYLGKFAHWFDYSNTLLSDTAVAGGASSVDLSLREIVLFLAYCMIIVPLALHLLYRKSYPFLPMEKLALWLWIGAGLAYAIFFTRIRFRLPFDWIIITSNGIFLAAVLEHRLRLWREKRELR